MLKLIEIIRNTYKKIYFYFNFLYFCFQTFISSPLLSEVVMKLQWFLALDIINGEYGRLTLHHNLRWANWSPSF